MNRLILFSLISACLLVELRGQGCSDAGFCTAGSIKPAMEEYGLIQNSLGLTLNHGLGERGISIITTQFEPQIRVSAKSMIQIKIPFVMINSYIANLQGLGDVILTYNYLVDTATKNPLFLTLGTRIATGTASLKSGDIALPMPYQVSLGTTDIILGAKMDLGKGYSLSLGFQQPLFNRNQNGFDSAAFKSLAVSEQIPAFDNYFISANLKRKGDILLRIDKSFRWTNTLITAGLLPIFHLGKDKVDISNNNTIELEGSQGLTLNLNASVYRKISQKSEFSFVFGTPLIVRKSRPDGLTRAFIYGLGLRYNL